MRDFFATRQDLSQHAIRKENLLAAVVVVGFSLAVREVKNLKSTVTRQTQVQLMRNGSLGQGVEVQSSAERLQLTSLGLGSS